jgi:hypothetical protein
MFVLAAAGKPCGRAGYGRGGDFHGRGIGRQLLVDSVAAAVANGFLRIELSVHSDNPVAAALVLLMAGLLPDELWELHT